MKAIYSVRVVIRELEGAQPFKYPYAVRPMLASSAVLHYSATYGDRVELRGVYIKSDGKPGIQTADASLSSYDEKPQWVLDLLERFRPTLPQWEVET